MPFWSTIYRVFFSRLRYVTLFFVTIRGYFMSYFSYFSMNSFLNSDWCYTNEKEELWDTCPIPKCCPNPKNEFVDAQASCGARPLLDGPLPRIIGRVENFKHVSWSFGSKLLATIWKLRFTTKNFWRKFAWPAKIEFWRKLRSETVYFPKRFDFWQSFQILTKISTFGQTYSAYHQIVTIRISKNCNYLKNFWVVFLVDNFWKLLKNGKT